MNYLHTMKRSPALYGALCVAVIGIACIAPKAHAQVSDEELTLLQAQVAVAEAALTKLEIGSGKVLGLSTLALTSTYSGMNYSSILEQIESLKSRVNSYKSGSSSNDDASRYSSWGNGGSQTSVAARKAAIQKQMDAIDDRIEVLQKQKADLQKQLDKLNASSTDSSVPNSSRGISLSHESDSATKDGSKGIFKMEFEVKAKDSDVYIKESTVQNAIFKKTAGVNFIIQKKATSSPSSPSPWRTVTESPQNVVTTGTVDATLASDATKSGGYFKVEEGESEIFTLTVNYTPTKSGSYQMRMMSVNWNTSAADAAKRTTARSGDFTTDLLSL